MRSSILIIYTGGTIGMKTDAATGALVPFDFSGIYDEFPSLKRLNVDIDGRTRTRSAAVAKVWARPVFFAIGNDATARPERARSSTRASVQHRPTRGVKSTQAQRAR